METLKAESEALDLKAGKSAKQLYRMLWRWHFYAGVFSIPFVIILSITGALYLFKPQLDALHDAPFRNLSVSGELTAPEQQVATALAAVPGAILTAYELPREATDAINILVDKSGEKIRVYIHPQTLSVLAIESEDSRFLRIVHDIHGELLLGKTGSILVELAACWAIVLVLTGVYLWWPRNAKGAAGILYPRLSLQGRLFWRDLHSVIAIWVSFFVLFLLLSGLPWALVWGSAFKELRQLTGTAAPKQDWILVGQKTAAPSIANEHLEHKQHVEHQQSAADGAEHPSHKSRASLNVIVDKAQQLDFAYPVLVLPPSQGSLNWSVKSNAQNRPLRADAYFSADRGDLTQQQHFSQRHFIDRAVGYGIAAHEGQLFGWFNQLLGLLTALGLLAISVSGFILWRKRAPAGVLGAPPQMPEAKIGRGFVAIILIAAILLPLLGCSLLVLALLEKILIARSRAAQQWLGLS